MKLAGLLLVWVLSAAAAAAPTTLDITVPESVKVQGEDSYICITKQLPDKPLKLVGVEPLARQEVVHHILLFGEWPCQLSLISRPLQPHADAVCILSL
jgi:hypothetical protein